MSKIKVTKSSGNVFKDLKIKSPKRSLKKYDTMKQISNKILNLSNELNFDKKIISFMLDIKINTLKNLLAFKRDKFSQKELDSIHRKLIYLNKLISVCKSGIPLKIVFEKS